MNCERVLEVADTAVLAKIGRHLSEVEAAILMGAWHSQTYQQIASASGYSASYLTRDIGPKLWKLLSQALGETVSKTNFRAALERQWRSLLREVESSTPLGLKVSQDTREPMEEGETDDPTVEPLAPTPCADWGEAPDVSQFYGRRAELQTLEQWIIGERCRLVALLGMGGIGKTALAVKLALRLRSGQARQVQGEFEWVIWRSLRNAPPLETLIGELVSLLSGQQDNCGEPKSLLHWLQKSRCLLVLDNVETIMQPGRAGDYRPGYEGYGELFRVVSESSHQSCVVLTSREKPSEIAALEGMEFAVRSMSLGGSPEAAQALIQAKGLLGSFEQKQQLSDRYSGNPLALKIVATSIQDLFDGEIGQFLEQDTAIFNSIRHLLAEQFDRLSPLEQGIMYWLAINREGTSISQLAADVVPPVSRADLLEALESLSWRSLIEKQSGGYTQQYAVMEYVSERSVEQVSEELAGDWNANSAFPVPQSALPLFYSHALIKTTVKDYVRESQQRLILAPIADKLRTLLGSSGALESQLQSVLQALRNPSAPPFGYGGGNLINLCRYLNIDLTGYDFSHLSVWHADLQGMTLQHVNFQNADLSKSSFTQTFGSIVAIAYSPDGELLATGDDKGEIHLRRVADGQHQITCKGHTNWVWSVAWSPDGRTLASSSADQTVRLWDAATGQLLHTLQGHTNRVWSVAWSPDGQTLASGSADQTVQLWDAATGQSLQTLLGHSDWVISVTFSPDGRFLASSGADRTVRLWDITTGQHLKTLEGHDDWVRSLAFSPDGQTLASGSHDRMVRLWDITTGQHLNTLAGHSNWVRSLAFSPDGQTLASGSADRTVRLWEIATGQVRKTLRGHTDWIRAIAFSPDGQTLASGSADRTVRFWEATTGQPLKTWQGHATWIRPIAFSPDGQTLVSGSSDRAVRLWDLATGRVSHTLQRHSQSIRSIAFSPDGRHLASGSEDRTIMVWDVAGHPLKTLRGHANWVWSVEFSPDGQMLASGSEDGTIKLWHWSSGQVLATLRGHGKSVQSVTFSPDGQMLASGSEDGTIKLWNCASGEVWQTLQGHVKSVESVTFSPDGQCLASGSEDSTVRLWEVTTGRALITWQEHGDWVHSVRFSPDGYTLASGSEDRTVRLWDVSTGQCRKILQGHGSQVWWVEWSPDGNVLASSSADETIRLWEVRTGQCQKLLRAERPYEGMNIAGVKGVTQAQKATLKLLGAVERGVGNGELGMTNDE